MDSVICLATKKVWVAKEIETLSTQNPNYKEKLRQIVCRICKRRASFVRRSVNNHDAHFKARHQTDCDAKSKFPKIMQDPDLNEEVSIIQRKDNEIEVDFGLQDFETNYLTQKGEDEEVSSPTALGKRRHTKFPPIKTLTTRGLPRILKYLMDSNSFATSDIKIHTGFGRPFLAKNLFVELSTVNRKWYEQWKRRNPKRPMFRAFWGFVTDANKSCTWLNSGQGRSLSDVVSICLSDSIRSNVLENHGISDADQLDGVYVFVFGFLKLSKKNKLYIEPRTADTIYLHVSELIQAACERKNAPSPVNPQISERDFGYSETSAIPRQEPVVTSQPTPPLNHSALLSVRLKNQYASSRLTRSEFPQNENQNTEIVSSFSHSSQSLEKKVAQKRAIESSWWQRASGRLKGFVSSLFS